MVPSELALSWPLLHDTSPPFSYTSSRPAQAHPFYLLSCHPSNAFTMPLQAYAGEHLPLPASSRCQLALRLAAHQGRAVLRGAGAAAPQECAAA